MAKDPTVAELEAVIAQLGQHQRDALKELFGDDGVPQPESKLVKKVLPKDKTFECEVLVVCRLCRTVHRNVYRSSSPLPSTMHTPTCGSCRTVLVAMSSNEIIDLAIQAAEGIYATVKEAKNADVECPTIDLGRKGDEGGAT